MNLKNINKFLIFFIVFNLLSCSDITINKKDEHYNSDINEVIEKEDIIKELNYANEFDFSDFYTRNNNFNWLDKIALKKQFEFSFGKCSQLIKNSSNFF